MALLHIDDKNFEKEVAQSKTEVIVDFWAEWCVDPQTEIMTSQGFSIPAQDVKTKDALLSHTKEGIRSDEVIRSFTSNKLGHCKQIITSSERKIKVTDEHQFLTPSGWRSAIELKKGDKVAIAPIYAKTSDEIVSEKEILSEKEIKSAAQERMKVAKYIEELQAKELLPLLINNEKTMIIARLLGSLFSDGNLYTQLKNNYQEISFSSGTKEDVESVSKDLERIGFRKIYTTKQRKKITFNERSYIITVYRIKVCSTALWLLCKALGTPVGDKTTNVYKIPEWIMKSPVPVKREFLAAYLGGDGPKIAMALSKRKGKEAYNTLSFNHLEFHKKPGALKSGLEFAQQLNILLKEFKIQVNNIFHEQDKCSDSQIIHLVFRQNFENAFNLYKNVGYRYANTKELESRYTAEFIRQILAQRQEWRSIYNQVISSFRKGNENHTAIADRFQLSSGTVWNWVKKNVKPTIKPHYKKFPTWLKEHTKGLSAGLVWEEIQEIHNIYLESVQKITMKTNHNFIANGFVAHNCGPCRLIAPIFEDLSKEYEGKVKFVKLNVDDQPELASQFGVMSIPTLIIFERGQEKERIVGAMNKQALKAKIEEALKK
ncbi:thioredoxin [Candidatus Woesearchaeota archaeon]|nr:thioredoxin [Candidatus Woesearchaeota archaeon]